MRKTGAGKPFVNKRYYSQLLGAAVGGTIMEIFWQQRGIFYIYQQAKSIFEELASPISASVIFTLLSHVC
jgi:hypothetical protein